MVVLRLLIGTALLTLGRKLFWVFVAGIGFIVGATLAARLLRDESDWLILLLGLGAGVLGAVLAVFLQQVAIGLAGFFAGGYFLLSLLEILGVEAPRLSWVPFIIGGIVGAVLAAVLFDWALITLSSLTGASLITRALDLDRPLSALVFFGTLALGLIIQSVVLINEQEPASPPPRPTGEPG